MCKGAAVKKNQVKTDWTLLVDDAEDDVDNDDFDTDDADNDDDDEMLTRPDGQLMTCPCPPKHWQ